MHDSLRYSVVHGTALLLLAAFFSAATAQPLTPTPPLPTPVPMPFDATGTWLGMTAAHAASANWATDAQDYASVNGFVRSIESLALGGYRARLHFDLRLGATYLSDTAQKDPLRVADNSAFSEVVISHPLSWMIDPYLSAGIRTSITESFQYRGDLRIAVAGLWDPVTSQQGAGLAWLDYSTSRYLSTRLGVSLLQIRSERNSSMTDDPRTPGIERYRAQSGIESVTEATIRIDSAATYTGRLGLFGTFQDLEIWSVRSDNELKVMFWKSFGIVVNLVIVHDVRQSLRTQYRESLSLGVVGQL